MVVTALEPESRAGGVRVHVDGKPYGTVAPADVGELRLEVGDALDEGRHAALVRRAEVFAAHVVALHVLRARALPGPEIQRRLVRKGHAPEAAEAAVRSLAAAGLVDDLEFARHYARTRAGRKGYGPGRIVRDLRRFGIPEREAEAAVRDALAGEGLEPLALAREAAARKLRGLTGMERGARERRLRAWLLRRGFAPADVIAAVREALDK